MSYSNNFFSLQNNNSLEKRRVVEIDYNDVVKNLNENIRALDIFVSDIKIEKSLKETLFDFVQNEIKTCIILNSKHSIKIDKTEELTKIDEQIKVIDKYLDDYKKICTDIFKLIFNEDSGYNKDNLLSEICKHIINNEKEFTKQEKNKCINDILDDIDPKKYNKDNIESILEKYKC